MPSGRAALLPSLSRCPAPPCVASCDLCPVVVRLPPPMSAPASTRRVRWKLDGAVLATLPCVHHSGGSALPPPRGGRRAKGGVARKRKSAAPQSLDEGAKGKDSSTAVSDPPAPTSAVATSPPPPPSSRAEEESSGSAPPSPIYDYPDPYDDASEQDKGDAYLSSAAAASEPSPPSVPQSLAVAAFIPSEAIDVPPSTPPREVVLVADDEDSDEAAVVAVGGGPSSAAPPAASDEEEDCRVDDSRTSTVVAAASVLRMTIDGKEETFSLGSQRPLISHSPQATPPTPSSSSSTSASVPSTPFSASASPSSRPRAPKSSASAGSKSRAGRGPAVHSHGHGPSASTQLTLSSDWTLTQPSPPPSAIGRPAVEEPLRAGEESEEVKGHVPALFRPRSREVQRRMSATTQPAGKRKAAKKRPAAAAALGSQRPQGSAEAEVSEGHRRAQGGASAAIAAAESAGPSQSRFAPCPQCQQSQPIALMNHHLDAECKGAPQEEPPKAEESKPPPPPPPALPLGSSAERRREPSTSPAAVLPSLASLLPSPQSPAEQSPSAVSLTPLPSTASAAVGAEDGGRHSGPPSAVVGPTLSVAAEGGVGPPSAAPPALLSSASTSLSGRSAEDDEAKSEHSTADPPSILSPASSLTSPAPPAVASPPVSPTSAEPPSEAGAVHPFFSKGAVTAAAFAVKRKGRLDGVKATTVGYFHLRYRPPPFSPSLDASTCAPSYVSEWDVRWIDAAAASLEPSLLPSAPPLAVQRYQDLTTGAVTEVHFTADDSVDVHPTVDFPDLPCNHTKSQQPTSAAQQPRLPPLPLMMHACAALRGVLLCVSGASSSVRLSSSLCCRRTFA